MRWLTLVMVLGACTQTPDPGDTDTSVDTGDSGDTDVAEIPIQWTDRTIETSATLNAVYSGGTGAVVVGTDGTSWSISSGRDTPLTTGVLDDLQGLWGRGDDDAAEVLAVGLAGSVLRLQGDAWVADQDPALGTTNFEDVDGTFDDLTAVSVTGVYHFDGTSWSFETNAFNRPLRSVYVADNGDVWSVGDQGTIVRRVDGTWSQVSAPTGADLRSVHGNGSAVYIVGNRGVLWRFNGTDFDVLNSETNVNLQGVWVGASGKAYVVGNNGVAFYWDPDKMPPVDEDDTDTPVPGAVSQLPTGSDANFYAIQGSDESNIWAVGNRGAAFRYTGPRSE